MISAERRYQDYPMGALWRRVVARALDMFTVFFLTFALVVGALFWIMDDLSDRWDPEPWGRAFVATFVYVVVLVTYEVVFVAARGQTPGKDVMKLKVVSVRSGRSPSVGRALLRTAGFGVAVAVPGVPIAGLATMALGLSVPLHPRRRDLPDLLAGTLVISYDAEVEEPPWPDDGETAGGPGSDPPLSPERYGAWLWGPLTRRLATKRGGSGRP